MAAKKSNNVNGIVFLLAMALGVFLIISGVTSVDVDSWRSFLMAAGFASLIFGIIGYCKK